MVLYKHSTVQDPYNQNLQKGKKSMELTILMPCLNEAETIVTCIKKAKAFLEREQIEGEILIADNGSTDQSQDLAIQQGARLIHVAERGYGAALIAGIKEAHGKLIIMGDADDSYDFLNLMPFLEKLRAGNDLVMGNRFQGGIKPGAMPFLNRYLGNPVLSFLGGLFFKTKIGDFHCGLRGMNKEAIAMLDLRAPGMEFASEMVVKASLKKLKITEVPTVLSKDGRSRPPHLRKWRDGYRHLQLLFLFSPRWMFLYPGMVLSFFGLLLMCLLAIAPLKIGQVAFNIHTLLYCSAFFVTGLQSVFFAIFARILATQHIHIPSNKTLEHLLSKFTLEKGFIIGLFFILLGMMGSSYSLSIWKHFQFGMLDPNKMMRIAIPSITFLISGTEIVFASLFINLITSKHYQIKQE